MKEMKDRREMRIRIKQGELTERMKKMDRATKIRVFKKLLDAGFDSEDAIRGFDLSDIRKTGLTLGDIEVVTGLKEAIKNRRIISYFAEDEDEKEDDAKAEEPKVEAAASQREVISNEIAKRKEILEKTQDNSIFELEKDRTR